MQRHKQQNNQTGQSLVSRVSMRQDIQDRTSKKTKNNPQYEMFQLKDLVKALVFMADMHEQIHSSLY